MNRDEKQVRGRLSKNVSDRAARNYLEQDGPRYEARYARPGPAPGIELSVVSWNIKFSRRVDEAIGDLTRQPELRAADILLLQEMDESGVDAIASALAFDYVYFPACAHPRTGQNFGNAILGKWPVSAPGKVLLPHLSPRTGEGRIATRAVVTISGLEVLVYSVHTETFALSLGKRQEQIGALVADIAGQKRERILAGGDFNTLRQKEVQWLDDRFETVELRRTTAGAGPTLKVGFLRLGFDHIFTKGMKPVANGTWAGTTASDHFPIWLRLVLD